MQQLRISGPIRYFLALEPEVLSQPLALPRQTPLDNRN